MTGNPRPLLSFDEIQQRGDQRMAEAREAIAESRRIVRESQLLREWIHGLHANERDYPRLDG